MRRGVKAVGVGAAVVLLLAGGAAWLGRESLRTWYYLRGLDAADEGDRGAWAECVAGLDQAAVPALLDRLGRDDARVCGNARAALLRLARRWGAGDARGAALARSLAGGFHRLSLSGQQEALLFAAAWLRGEEGPAPAAEVARLLTPLLPEAGRTADPGLRAGALELAAALLGRPEAPEALPACRELARACLTDGDAENRGRAVGLALHPGMDLHRPVLPLLRDPSAEVRRLAMLAVGPAAEVIGTEELLHWLHDPDPEVRRLCEMALRGRKLSDNHIRLGRLLTDEQHQVRLQVLDHLSRAGDLDPGVWLRYLSQDPVPSVRAAAMRAATDHFPQVTFSDRLEQMRADPEPSVRQLAGHYLREKKQQEALLGR
jgi:HEAT repeat protein